MSMMTIERAAEIGREYGEREAGAMVTPVRAGRAEDYATGVEDALRQEWGDTFRDASWEEQEPLVHAACHAAREVFEAYEQAEATDKIAAAIETAIETSQRENRTVDLSASALGCDIDTLLDEVMGLVKCDGSVGLGDDVYDCWGSDDSLGDWRLEVTP